MKYLGLQAIRQNIEIDTHAFEIHMNTLLQACIWLNDFMLFQIIRGK